MAKVIVIGGSAAGMSFAAKYHRNCPQDEILLFENNEYISFGACGLPYYVQEQFTNKDEMFARTPMQVIDSGIDVRVLHRVTNIDYAQKKVVANDTSFEYDKLVIATGAKPIVPRFAKVDNKQVFTLTTMADGDALKAKLQSGISHVTVIGAGFIGLEVMDAAHHLGLDVTVVEQKSNILANQFGSDMTQIVQAAIDNHNIDLQLDTSVQSIESGERLNVKTDRGEFETDCVVLAIGFMPNSELFTGDKMANGAILVDAIGQTSLHDVYAVGDCATTKNLISKEDMYLPLATNANKFAKSLADNLAGIDNSFEGMLASSCIKVLDYDMARTGSSEKQLADASIDYKVKVLKDKTHTSYYQGQEDIYIKLIYAPDSLLILGAEVVGRKDVVGRLNVIAACISANITTKQLAYIDFAYAPPFSRTWEALNTAGNIAK